MGIKIRERADINMPLEGRVIAFQQRHRRWRFQLSLGLLESRLENRGWVRGDNQGETRIASPRSAPEQLCRCLTWMFPVVATRHSVIAWKAAADEVVPNTIS